MVWPCYVNRYAHLSVSGCLRLLANNLNSERTCLKRLLCQKSEIRKISARNMATTVTAAAYGGWKSPITSELATKSSVSFQELHVDKAQGNQGAVYWSELRFDEGGRIVICSRTKDEADITQWTPKDFNARTRVHEYGGGAFFVHDSAVYFSNFVDQRLYIQKSASDLPQPLTLENCGWRYADGQYNATLKRIFCVREDHSLVEKGESKEPINTVVCINPDTQEQHVLASGCDFYSCPRVTADGSTIAWVQWNHPNMPWDDTELCVAELDSSGDTVKADTRRKVAGGKGVSVMYPSWTSDNELLYIGDQSDWWNLYHVTSDGKHVNLHAASKELGRPLWVFADYPYDIDSNGRVVTTYGDEFAVLDIKTGAYRVLDTGFSSHGYVQCLPESGLVYCTSGSPTQFPCVISVDSDTAEVGVLKESRSVSVDHSYLSVPEEISWPSGKDQVAHGFFYPPKNKDMEGVRGTLPPLLVRIHGGPTAQFNNVLSLGIQYFTSRGIAVLCVNNRGSTGYGRKYRHLLNGNWGIYDVEDCCSGATYLADKGLVDRNKLCIDGGSAGGYTTLACLAFKDVFKAGASLYGIGDLASLVSDTHKFESRYIEQLVAPFSSENIKVWNDRSPVKHLESFNCPVVLFQGDEDKIVLPNQAESMFNALKTKGIPCAYVLYKGEQHGFRKAENIQKTLDGELFFFGRVFGFEPADKKGELEIVNLK